MVDKLDTALVEATLGSDLESFGELCSRYYASMVAIAYSVLDDHQLAEDAAQETFARARRPKRLKKQNKIRSLAGCHLQKCRQGYGRKRRKQINAEGLRKVADCSNPDDKVFAIRQAIEQLPASGKELVILRYYDGLSYEEISAVLGISRASINGRLTRAKRKIGKYLQRNGFLENRL